MKKVELNVIGMSCGHCAKVIKGSVGSLAGVGNVRVDLNKGKVAIDFLPDLVSFDLIKETIDEQGYDIA